MVLSIPKRPRQIFSFNSARDSSVNIPHSAFRNGCLRVGARHSSQELPTGLTKAEVTVKLNTDLGIAGMSSQDLQAGVGAWELGGISRDVVFVVFGTCDV